MQAVRKILNYLKATPGKGILFKSGEELDIKGFTYADYTGSLIDRRSTSGYCVFFGGNLVMEEQEAKCCGKIKSGG